MHRGGVATRLWHDRAIERSTYRSPKKRVLAPDPTPTHAPIAAPIITSAAAGGLAVEHDPLATPIGSDTATRPHKRPRLGHTDYVVDASGSVRQLSRDQAAAAFLRGSRNAQLDDFRAAPLAFSPGRNSNLPVHSGAVARQKQRALQRDVHAKHRRDRERRQLAASRDASSILQPAATPPGMLSLHAQGQAVMRLASDFGADRTKPHAFPGAPEIGSLRPAHLTRYDLAAWNAHHPGEKSAFAAPRADGKAMGTTYNEASGVYSGQEFAAPTPDGALRRALVSSAESVRTPGAGPAQLLAEDARATAGIANRDEMYGRFVGAKSTPGFVPGSYSGSAMDIQMAERHSADPDVAALAINPFAPRVGVLSELAKNPFVQQVGEVLATHRSRQADSPTDVPPRRLQRSLSVGTQASARDYEDDAERALRALGLRSLQGPRES